MADLPFVLLEFDPQLNKFAKNKELRQDLSGVVQIGNTLWVVNDETSTLERLTYVLSSTHDAYRCADHKQFALSDYLALPMPRRPDAKEIVEADIEALGYGDGYLWLAGSHSLKRSEPDRQSTKENFAALANLTRDNNRCLLARIPVVEQDGLYTLVKEAKQNGKRRTAAQLRGSNLGNELTAALAHDEHLQPFLALANKENGLDIEGLAVGDKGRIFLGLRGPVLRGWAVILELQPEVDGKNRTELRLKEINPKNLHNPDYATYRKHFLDLDGLGVRDLYRDGADLLILAGPTMDLDGPTALFRWSGGAESRKEQWVAREQLQKLFDLPYGSDEDHPEGITLFTPPGDTTRFMLVVYDAASKSRQIEESTLRADLFPPPA